MKIDDGCTQVYRTRLTSSVSSRVVIGYTRLNEQKGAASFEAIPKKSEDVEKRGIFAQNFIFLVL